MFAGNRVNRARPHLTMKITNLEFTLLEAATLKLRAVTELIQQGHSKAEARQLVTTETPQNVLRLALGFNRRKRGGSRPNTGNRYPKPSD